MEESQNNLTQVGEDTEADEHLRKATVEDVVADKVYHSNEVVRRLRQQGIRSHISEPKYKG